jgi:hypothetical protein
MDRTKRFWMRFAISTAVAVATPAVAAGLVAGTSVAIQTSSDAVNQTIYSTQDDGGAASAPNPASVEATHGPARLTALVGNDQAAWDSAHSVHVTFTRKPR